MNAFQESQDLLKAAFSVIDPDGKGFITLQMLRNAVRELDLDFTDEELRDMIDEADPTGEGQVNIDNVQTMFVETHLALSAEAKKRWKQIKNRVKLPKYRKRFIAEKVKVKKVPGQKLSKQEEKNINRFNRLSLKPPPEKTKVIKKPGVALRERRELELEQERASGDEDNDESGTKKHATRNIRVVSRNAKPYAKKNNNNNKTTNSKETAQTEAVKPKTNNKDSTHTDTADKKAVPKEEMSQHYNDNDGNEGYYGEDDYDQQQYENTSLPPIEKNNGVAPQQNQHGSPNTGKKIPVHERLYDPDYRKNRSIPTEPEPIYVREFKSRPPKKLEHVKSKHMDPNLWEPRGEYILETDEEPQSPQFKAKLPKGMEHIESRHMNPEYQKKRQSSDESAGEEQPVPQFHARIPKGMEHVQSKILDAKYYQEKPPPEEEHYDTEFRARPPKKLESVQSRIMDPRYFQEKVYPEEEKPDVEFKARLPKKLEHVQSRLLDPPKKPKVNYEEADTISLPSFRAKPPRHLEQVSSRILDPHYFEPKPHEPSHEAEDKYDHNFKAKIPKGMQHVESRALDPKYYRKKIPPIPTEEREAQSINHNFKASPPKQLAHIQSRAFDPAYNRALSPRSGSPIVELKQRGGVVVINVKKDPERRSKSQGYKEKMVSPRGQYNNYHNRQEGGSKSGLGLVEEPKGSVSEKKEPKRWRPPRKPKVDKVNKEFFDSWVVSPTTIYHDNSDMFYRNRQEVSEMWTSLARTIKKTVVENGERIRPIERTYY